VIKSFKARLFKRSAAVVVTLENEHRQIVLYWTMVASFACGLRLSAGHFLTMPLPAQFVSALPYVLAIGAPIASLFLAFHWFRQGDQMPQPSIRLARFGRWRVVTGAEARRHNLFGATGIMASLLVGILLNIPVRTLEFLAAMPVLGAAPPSWFGTLYSLMLVDAVLLCSLYAVAFVAALRHVPLFPRLLAIIWVVDIVMQIGIARSMATVPDLPPRVAGALQTLLDGNLKKVLISVALWAPYLLLSQRVNVTYRHRLPQ